MAKLASYKERYPCASLERTEGVLTVRLHTDGHSLRWNPQVHRELSLLFADIGSDLENRVVILTGTGDVFCTDANPLESHGGAIEPQQGYSVAGVPPDQWNVIYSDGKRLLGALVDIDVPVIGAVNGPAHIHAEILALSDIVLATPDTTFRDRHMANGVVAGDGVHVVWPMLLGPNRGRYFLMTSEVLSAEQAKGLGVVAEIVPREQLMDRAGELAQDLAKMDPLVTRYSRIAMTNELRRRMHQDLGYGLVLEGLAAAAGRTRDPATPLVTEL